MVRLSSLTDNVTLHAVVTNTGSLVGDEVLLFAVPVKLQRPASELGTRLPYKRLIDFTRASGLAASASTNVTFMVGPDALGVTNSKGDTVLYSGEHILCVTRGHGKNLTAIVMVEAGESGSVIDTLM